mgnify:CR=1 FL=1|tara:strand:+ start:1166 stop:1666 length:501 start_codon:yes stop_codon:yes gene_type:complete
MSVTIRAMESRDCEALAAIYNQVIDERVATFNTEHIDADGVAGWTESGLVLVADSGRDAVGFVRSFPYRTRPCYEGIAQFSIYVGDAARGLGIGDLLMAAFLDALVAEGKWKVLSRVFPENEASLSLLAAHGFREVGIYRNHALLDGVWRDVIIVERLLGPAERNA